MSHSIFRSRLSALTKDQWRILRLAGFAAVLAQLIIIFNNGHEEMRFVDLMLFSSYLMGTAIFVTGSNRYGKGGEKHCEPVYLSIVQERVSRALILFTVALFTWGGFKAPEIFWSSGMVALMFQVVFLWVMTTTTREARTDGTDGHAEPVPVTVGSLDAQTTITGTPGQAAA